jgi:hypothetical protein
MLQNQDNSFSLILFISGELHYNSVMLHLKAFSPIEASHVEERAQVER